MVTKGHETRKALPLESLFRIHSLAHHPQSTQLINMILAPLFALALTVSASPLSRSSASDDDVFPAKIDLGNGKSGYKAPLHALAIDQGVEPVPDGYSESHLHLFNLETGRHRHGNVRGLSSSGGGMRGRVGPDRCNEWIDKAASRYLPNMGTTLGQAKPSSKSNVRSRASMSAR